MEGEWFLGALNFGTHAAWHKTFASEKELKQSVSLALICQLEREKEVETSHGEGRGCASDARPVVFHLCPNEMSRCLISALTDALSAASYSLRCSKI